MKSLLCMFAVALGCYAAVPGDELPEEHALGRAPRERAVEINPAGFWQASREPSLGETQVIGLDQESGFPKMRVAHAGMLHRWSRPIDIPIATEQYPLLILTYRATGVCSSDEPLLQLGFSQPGGGGTISVFRNRDVLSDGKPHELTADLRKLAPDASVRRLALGPHCQGPEPAMLDVLGIRFEADEELPTVEPSEAEFSLRVVDAAGQAVEEATVTVDAERLNWTVSAQTNASGDATVRPFRTLDEQHTLSVTMPGSLPIVLHHTDWQPLPRIVTLLDATHYGGTVVNEDGEPVAGVSVTIATHTGQDFEGRYDTLNAAVLTDAAGRWRSPPFPREPRSLRIVLRHPDYVTRTYERASAQEAFRLACPGGPPAVLLRGVRMQGRVVSANGDVVARALVKMRRGPGPRPEAIAETDANGQFVLAPTSPGDVSLTVECGGLAPAFVETANAPDAEPLTITLSPGRTVHGRVVDEDGQPIAGVSLSVGKWQGVCGRLGWRGETDAEGRFAWDSAPLDSVSLSAQKSGRGWRMFDIGPEEKEWMVTLQPRPQITGKIVSGLLRLPVSAGVVLQGSVYGKPGSKTSRISWHRYDAKPIVDGHYELMRYSNPGPMLLRVEAPGFKPSVSEPVPLEDGPQTIDFVLKRGNGLEGIVLLPDGTPADGAKIVLNEGRSTNLSTDETMPPEGPGYHAVTTGADGKFWFADPDDEWTLRAFHGMGGATASGRDSSQPITLRLEPYGQIAGKLCVDGEPVANRWVLLMKARHNVPSGFADGQGRRTMTDSQGRFAFARVPQGRMAVLAETWDGPSGDIMRLGAAMDIAAGEKQSITLGGSGRPVIGRLDVPEQATSAVDSERSRAWIVTLAEPKLPSHLAASAETPQLDTVRLLEWLNGEEGRRYSEAVRAYNRTLDADGNPPTTERYYGVTLHTDGSFRVGRIPADTYRLVVALYPPATDPNAYRAIGTVDRFITVPAAIEADAGKPFDLGALPAVQPRH